jgi:hypothetical protein
MGCKQSQLRDGGDEKDELDRPKVPSECWYAKPLTELSLLPMTAFHEAQRGRVCFARRPVPTSRRELDRLPGSQPQVFPDAAVVDLSDGSATLFTMAYLYNTGLYTEHMWRMRVSHGAENRFMRPFYDTLITVKATIDGVPVPDAAPHSASVAGCTATLEAPDALARWKHVPLVFLPDPSHPTFTAIRLWDGLIRSFATACARLAPGEHALHVEIGYGCHNEDDFSSGYIALGDITIRADDATAPRMMQVLDMLPREPPGRYVDTVGDDALVRCYKCNKLLKHVCTVCGASVCGVSDCVFTERTGYPLSCESHPAFVPEADVY